MHFFSYSGSLKIEFIGSKNSLLCLVNVLKQAKIPLLLGIALPNFGSKKLTGSFYFTFMYLNSHYLGTYCIFIMHTYIYTTFLLKLLSDSTVIICIPKQLASKKYCYYDPIQCFGWQSSFTVGMTVMTRGLSRGAQGGLLFYFFTFTR